MHSDVTWFDTAACIDAPAYVSEVNKVSLTSTEFGNREAGDPSDDDFTDDESPNVTAGWWSQSNAPRNANGDVDWRSDVEMEGTINRNDDKLYLTYLTEYIKLVEDCDMDCQKRGSQLTLVA